MTRARTWPRWPGKPRRPARTLLETTGEVIGPSGETPEQGLLDDSGREHRHPAIVLVSNNPYALDPPLARGTARH